MAEPLLTFANAEHRHMISAPTLARPWKKVKGPGIVGLNLNVYAGCVLGLVGPNGAGKTTLLRMMAGILPLQGGTVTACFSSTEPEHVDDLRQWVGHMPEQVRWQGGQTVREALEAIGDMRNTPSKRIDGLLDLVGLSLRKDERLDNLSQGMRQRLSIAAALLGSPKVLLLDEPFNGLDPVAAEAFTHLVKRLASKGVAVVISSHMVAQLDQLIDRIALLHRGQLLDEGNLEEVEGRLDLSNRYRIKGKGIVDLASSLSDIDHEPLGFEMNNDEWNFIFRGQEKAVLNALMNSATVTSWSPMAPNLVELLCAATGMEVEDISLEVGSSAMLPMRTSEVSEDE
ncbi:ABC transporter ATP-binding protein [Candidatus Poseidonia alphae]|nr:ABC transporter ATP-binding protein [Candidatus Poseidonia alphae]MDA8749863.1 ABC transporter ATP-binding protein [Candidatus Poseidonia alphae]